MAGPLSREQYNAVRQRVIGSAPDGLSREQFNKLLDDELTKEEAGQTQHTEGKPEGSFMQSGMDAVRLALENSPFGNIPEAIEGGKKAIGYVKDHPAAAGAMAGGAIAAPLTGGMSIPAAAALVGLGGAGGAAYGELGKGAATGDFGTSLGNAEEIAKEGGLAAGGEGIARGVAAGAHAVAPSVRNVAVSGYQRMLKPTKAAVSQLARFGETLPERARGVSAALLDNGINITQGGARKIHDMISSLADQASQKMEGAINAGARGRTSLITDEMQGTKKFIGRQLAPSSDRAAAEGVMADVQNNPLLTKRVRGRRLAEGEIDPQTGELPTEIFDTGKRRLLPTVSVKTLDDLKRGTYRSLGNRSFGEMKGAATEMEKAAARGTRKSIEEVVPDVGPIHEQEASMIDQADVLDEAAFRGGKHNPLSLTDDIALSGKHPGLLLASLLNHPGVGSPIMRTLNAASRGLAGAGSHGNLIRAALIALMNQTPPEADGPR